MRSWVELVIVIAIGIIVAGLFVMGTSRVRVTRDETLCGSHLKHVLLGLHNYEGAHKKLPLASVANDDLPLEKRLGLFCRLFPFIENRMDLRGNFHDDLRAWDDGENKKLAESGPWCLFCPANPDQGSPFNLTHYVGLAGVGGDAAFYASDDRRIGMFGYHRQLSLRDITDGLENTIALAETATDNGCWLAAGPASVRGLGAARAYLGKSEFTSLHGNRVNVALADASVRTLHPRFSPRLLEALVTVQGKETVEAW
jgi:prepilin-type processing-associated H-X9-DG protein